MKNTNFNYQKKETNDVISDIRYTNIKWIQETDDNLDWSILLKYIGFYEVKVFKNCFQKKNNNNNKTIKLIKGFANFRWYSERWGLAVGL